MIRLLLVSSSKVHGSGYLAHCAEDVRRLFDGAGEVLFVPFALADQDGYAAQAEKRFRELGLVLRSIHRTDDPIQAAAQAEGIFIGGGNTFRLLKTLYDLDLLDPIRRAVQGGTPYLGTSAGSNVAGPTIRTTNDMPIARPPSFAALDLVPFQINPHYIDADPTSKHQGETRDQRLQEFHEENETPVVAIREGAMIAVENEHYELRGATGGKLFRRGLPSLELPPGALLGPLLGT